MKKLLLFLLCFPSLGWGSSIFNPGGGSGGGGGGSSTLQVTASGVQITSPTSSMNFNSNDFSVRSIGTTAYFLLNPATTNYIHNQSTLQSGATAYPSFAVVGSVNANQGPGNASYMAATLAALTVVASTNNANNGQTAFYSQALTSPFVTSREFVYGATSEGDWYGPTLSPSGRLYGQQTKGLYLGTGQIGNSVGTVAYGINGATGTVGNLLAGVEAIAINSGGGTVTNSEAVYAQTFSVNGSTTDTNFGIFVASAVKDTASILTLNYGLYLDTQTAGATNYGLVSVANNDVFTGTVTVGRLNLSNVASGTQCLHADSTGRITGTGSDCGSGGGGGSSSLQVTQSGVQITSPTTSINFNTNDFGLLAVGSTATVVLNPATTNYIHNQTNPQTATANIDSATVRTELNTSSVTFLYKNSMLKYPDKTSLLSMPDVQTMYFGYGSAIVPTGGGTFNTCLGAACMANVTTGNFNTGLGNSVMTATLTGEQNNCIGYAACAALQGGSYNNGMGGSSLANTTSGSENTAVGTLSLNLNTTGNGNTGVGLQSQQFNSDGIGNVSIGYQAGNSTASVNANRSGDFNTYLGYQTGQSVSSSTILDNSIAIGHGALFEASNIAQIGGRVGSAGLEVRLRTTSATIETASLNINNVTYLWPGSQASGTKILSNDGSGNLSWQTDATGGGGGSSTLAVTTGTFAGFNPPAIASPTAVIDFHQSQFRVRLAGGATAFVEVDPSSVTLLGQSIDISANTNLAASGNANLSGDTVNVGLISLSTGIAGTLDISANSNLAASGSANLSNDTINVGLISLSTGVVGTLDISANTNLAVSGSANLSNDTVNVGPISLSTAVIGSLQAAQEPAHTGDVTNSAGSLAMTAAGTQANIKVFTSAITMTSSLTVTNAALLGANGSAVTISSNAVMPGATFYQNGNSRIGSAGFQTVFAGDVNISSGLWLAGSAGTNAQVLTSGGPNTTPTWTTPSAGGGGGSSTLAVGTGTIAGFDIPLVSSPTAVINFDKDAFKVSLQGGATAFVEIKTVRDFFPEDAQFLTTSFPQIVVSTFTNFAVSGLSFDASISTETANWRFRAQNYRTGSLTLDLYWYGATAVTGNVVWSARISAVTPDTDSGQLLTESPDVWDTVTVSHLGTNATRLHKATITISDLDSLADDDIVWILIGRNGANGGDTMAGDAVLVYATLTY